MDKNHNRNVLTNYYRLHSGHSFDYYNADGKQSSMCGNGGRCIVAFAKALQIIESTTTFMAIDGLHEASVTENGIVHLKMQDVSEIQTNPT